MPGQGLALYQGAAARLRRPAGEQEGVALAETMGARYGQALAPRDKPLAAAQGRSVACFPPT